jgi:methylthioribose-1-phosphate isomerase
MKAVESLALRSDGDRVWILDQERLPGEALWIDVTSPEAMAQAIVRLKIRGAPLIGVGAALCLGLFHRKGAKGENFLRAAKLLAEARPTAVNLRWAVEKVRDASDPWSEALRLYEEDVALCDRMGRHGADLIRDGDRVLTHCNTGGLATAGIGTALGAIRKAFESGKKIHVFVDETRPLLQGARLTAWELAKLGIPHTLLCDNAAGSLMKAGKVNRVFVGADRIARNGDFANKIGTYGVAVLAKHHGIPFYAVAPVTTIDPDCPGASAIPIEQRAPDEVRGARGSFGEVIWSPSASDAYNPAFDVTPASLVTALVLDTGVFAPSDLEKSLARRG